MDVTLVDSTFNELNVKSTAIIFKPLLECCYPFISIQKLLFSIAVLRINGCGFVLQKYG